MRSILFNIMLLFIVSCTGQVTDINNIDSEFVKSSNVFIKSNFKNASFFYTDSLGDGHSLYLSKETSISLSMPMFVFQTNESNNPYIIFPSDSIEIKDFGSDIKILSINSFQRTIEFDFLKTMVSETGPFFYHYILPQNYFKNPINETYQIEEIEKKIEGRRKKREELLKAFVLKNKTSKKFINIINEFINADYFNEHLLLNWKARDLLLKRGQYLNRIDSINQIIYSIPFTLNPIYLKLLNNSLSVRLSKYRDHYVSNEKELKQWYDYILAKTSNNIKSYLLAYILKTAIKKNFVISGEIEKGFYDNCLDSNYRKIIKMEIENKDISHSASILPNEDYLIDVKMSQRTSIEKIIRENRNKIILIDFWASWCIPCRREFKFSKILMSKYSPEKISFVFISTDKDFSSWIKATKDEQIFNKNSFCLTKSMSSDFVRRLKITTIPRYILIGKNGKIISENAPYPSDIGMSKLIDKALNN